jgi:IclR family KDG regulon transcriptional repressor
MTSIRVKSASRVIQILELLASNKYGMQHKRIVEELEIPKGSLTKLLANLLDTGYLSLDSGSKTYKLGPRVLALANSYLSGLDIVQIAQPILRNLAEKTGESVSLAVPDGNSALVVHRQYGSQPMSFRLGMGARIPMYATASGKAILAFLPKEKVEDYLSSEELKALTNWTITDPSSLLHELERVRNQGFAYSRQEQFEGLAAIAAPVFRSEGYVAGSVTVMYLNVRSETIHFHVLETALKEAANELSECLGYRMNRSAEGLFIHPVPSDGSLPNKKGEESL